MGVWASDLFVEWLRNMLSSNNMMFQRHTFSEVFGSLTNWVSLRAGCKTNLWKAKGKRERKICYTLILRKYILLSFSLKMICASKANSGQFHSPDKQQVDMGIIGLGNRFKYLLKCNYYTSLIDLNNLLNEFIYFVSDNLQYSSSYLTEMRTD